MAREQRIVFTGKDEMDMEVYETPQPGKGEVRVRSEVSLISTGTETTALHRNFEPGSHWESWVVYPFYPGYSIVGWVEALDKNVTSLELGDRVALRRGHASCHLVTESECHIVPSSCNPKEAAWFALAKIAFMGAKVAPFTMGTSLLVIGAGPIGQMTVRWAYALGCRDILVADRICERLEFARAGGASQVYPTSVANLAASIEESGNDQMPELIVDTTGNETVLSHALRLVADRGTVVILGDTGSPSQQRLTKDVITRGLTVVGAHDTHETSRWNSQEITRLFFTFLSSNRFSLNGLNTHEFSYEDYRSAYELADTRRAGTMGIQLLWSSG